MTDEADTRDQQGAPEPPQEGGPPSPDGGAAPESVDTSLDETVEVPRPLLEDETTMVQAIVPAVEPAAAETEQPTVVAPVAPATEPPLDSTEQPTVVIPVALLVPPPGAETAPTEPEKLQPTIVISTVPDADLVPPPAELVPPPAEPVTTSAETGPPPADSDQTLSDTLESTLGDITLTEAGGASLTEWFRGLRLRRGAKPQEAPAPPVEPAVKTRHWGLLTWQWVLVSVSAIVLVLGVFIGADAGLYYNKVHHGIKVAGQNLSGMTSEQATAELAKFTEEAQNKAITLSSGDRTWEILPSDLGTTIDVPAAVSKAMALTRDNNLFVDVFKKLGLFFVPRDVPLEGSVDSEKMDALLTKIASAIDVPATNATLVVNNGVLEVAQGQKGSVVDRNTLRNSLTRLLLTFHSTKLTVPMMATSPDINSVDIAPVLADANLMRSADLVVTSKGTTLATLAPEDIVNYLDVAIRTENGDSKAVAVLSAQKMAKFFDGLDSKVDVPGVDATLAVDTKTKTISVVPGTDGQGVDREATAELMTDAAMSLTSRTTEVVMKAVPPERTTEDLQALGITDLLADYATTPYTGTANRQINVRLATRLCSGVFLAPGEEFNTDKRLGVRDAAHGWALAKGITGGGKLEDVFGGGICQVSTTLFNAALLAGLEITKRYNHSLYINHYPDGRDATVTAGSKNMCFRNDTSHYIFVYGTSTGVRTHFYIFGVADGRKVLPIAFSGFVVGPPFPTQTIINTSLPLGTTVEDVTGQSSRSCSITRTVIYADGTKKTQTWQSRWAQMSRVIETNPLPTTTTTVHTTTTAHSTTTTVHSTTTT